MFWCYFKTYFSIRDEQILFQSVWNCGLINDIKVDLLNETNWIDSSEIIWTRMETFLNRIETKTVDKLLECSYQLSLGRWGTGQFIWLNRPSSFIFGGIQRTSLKNFVKANIFRKIGKIRALLYIRYMSIYLNSIDGAPVMYF